MSRNRWTFVGVVCACSWGASAESITTSSGGVTIVETTVWDSSTSQTPTDGYGLSKDDLGGGSIGVVPFDIHGIDCQPMNGVCLGSENHPDTGEADVEIEHYGPVAFDDTSGDPPLKVFKRECGAMSWTQVSTSDYTVD